MTIDEIMVRKRKLVDERSELQRQLVEHDNDDVLLELNIQTLTEEIMDLNAQLRTLQGRRSHGGSRGTTHNERAMGQVAYQQWLGSSDEDENPVGRAKLLVDTIGNAEGIVTPRQHELLDAYVGGATITQLAERFDIDKSTASRTISRAKSRLREEADYRIRRSQLDDGGARSAIFDLSDPDTLRLILSCLTEHQMVCIYLYYGEWLTLRECGELLGMDHTAVLRTTRRGLLAIQKTLYLDSFVLDNVDVLDEFAYNLYMESGGGQPDLGPSDLKDRWNRATRQSEKLKTIDALSATPKQVELPQKSDSALRPSPAAITPNVTIRTSDGLESKRGIAHHSIDRPMGKFLTMLWTFSAQGSIFSWLKSLFKKFTRKSFR